jgi:hypothetical protein
MVLIALLFVILGGGCAFIESGSEGLVVEVPSGVPPRIDGVLSPGEWDGAMHVELDDVRHLYFMQNDGYLYLGIDSGTMGYGSICIAGDDRVSLLHASAALGTAIFEREGEDWRRIRQFSYCCRETEPGPRQEQHLEEEGWLASIVYMGISDEMEYQIVMPADGLVMAVVHQTGQTVTSALRWPETINDDCLGVVGILDDPPERLDFSPETWPVFIAAGD